MRKRNPSVAPENRIPGYHSRYIGRLTIREYDTIDLCDKISYRGVTNIEYFKNVHGKNGNDGYERMLYTMNKFGLIAFTYEPCKAKPETLQRIGIIVTEKGYEYFNEANEWLDRAALAS